jgi:hypothetical protein
MQGYQKCNKLLNPSAIQWHRNWEYVMNTQILPTWALQRSASRMFGQQETDRDRTVKGRQLLNFILTSPAGQCIICDMVILTRVQDIFCVEMRAWKHIQYYYQKHCNSLGWAATIVLVFSRRPAFEYWPATRDHDVLRDSTPTPPHHLQENDIMFSKRSRLLPNSLQYTTNLSAFVKRRDVILLVHRPVAVWIWQLISISCRGWNTSNVRYSISWCGVCFLP